ncbi:CHAT domain-containing protein [Aphanothece hegewaldii]|uniref:CHAT domain-containing protein n=1 Tax=Aphanothece hegewaldii TaxID=1521625 RepID=UPI001C62B6AF|nr:CHAT domain-containing protein [Aphanothece hegewaldii]
MQQGREFYQLEQFYQAVTVWQQALKIYYSQDDELNQILVLNYLSLAYQKLGQWEEANRSIAESLKRLKTNHPEQLSLLAQALNAQGSLQYTQGQTETALETWQQATAIYHQVADEIGYIGSLLNQAQAQQTLGLYLSAKRTLVQSEEILQQQSNLQLKITGLRSLGNTLQAIGEFEESKRVLEQSLALAQEQGSSEIAATLLSLGNTLRSQQEPEIALTHYQKAANLSGTTILRVQSQLNELDLLLELERSQQAKNLATIIEKQIDDLPISRIAIYSKINLAQSLLKFPDRQPLNIAKLLVTAVQQAKTLSDRRAESYALGYLGQLYEKSQQWSNAQKLSEQALLLANAPDLAYQWQWQLGRIFKAQKQAEIAINYYNAAFNTLQSLRSNLVAINSDIQFSFRESVEPVYRQLVDLLLSSTDTENPSNLQKAREVIEALQIAELNDFFRSACLEGQKVPIDQIPQTEAAVIYPIILTDRIEIILSLPEQPLRHYSISVSEQKVKKDLEQLRYYLEKPYITSVGKSLAQQVYNWLIQPIAANLTQNQIKTLVFVLDGELRNVPMAALFDGQQYLIEKYAIAIAPGLQLLNPKPLLQKKLNVLLAGLTQERHGFIALPNVIEELKNIQTQVPSQVLLDKTFTSSELQQELESVPFSVVHLATHGQFSSKAEQTFILAWDKPINVNELKTLLLVRDKTNSEALELLVLSACQTAEGDDRAALGLAGVVVRSRSRSVLASLWNVDDASAVPLLSQFYRELATKTKTVTKAEALRQAQLSLLRDPDYRYPVYWASFVLIGNWL